MWARLSELGTDKPIFGDRDRTIHYDVSELSDERRAGYTWYGEWPAGVLKKYQTWRKTVRAAEPASDGSRLHRTYLIVHGAWGGGWAFKEVDKLLTADGHKVYRPTLTGQGERVHLASTNINLSLHVKDIVNVILWEDLHDVVLVGHSYGGMVVTGVADQLPGRIKHLIYVDAFVPENGETANSIRGRTGLDRPVVNGFVMPTWLTGSEPLPHDVPHPLESFDEAISLVNQTVAGTLPATYVLTVVQGKRAEDDEFYRFCTRATARGWTTLSIEADHNPQWSRPEELVRLLETVP
jgi:pimeloyl-ACP methyl ester carboxylesterase